MAQTRAVKLTREPSQWHAKGYFYTVRTNGNLIDSGGNFLEMYCIYYDEAKL